MKRFKIFAACFLLIAVLGTVVLLVDGLCDDIQRSDVGIVLGSKVMPDGTPSSRLRARLDKTAELYRQGLFPRIIVSGGPGVPGFPEAQVMANYLIEHQSISAVVILLDENGNTTEQTAMNSAAIMKANHFRSAMLVTQYFHVTRSRYALHRAGIETVHSAHANYFDVRDPYSTVRELIALPVYWIKMR